MGDALFLNGKQGQVEGRGLRRRVFAAFMMVATAGAEMQAAAQAPRDSPRVLVPVESSAAMARVRARGLVLRSAGGTTLIYLLDDGGLAKGERKPGQEMKLKAVPLNKLGAEFDMRPAEQVLPLRAAFVVASFPFQAQVEEFRDKLRLPSVEAVLREGASRPPSAFSGSQSSGGRWTEPASR